MESVFNKPQKSRASQDSTKLKKRIPCEKCRKSFTNFRAAHYHLVVAHNDPVDKNKRPSLGACLSKLEKQYEKFLGSIDNCKINQTGLQCPCSTSINEKQLVKYNFGLLGIKEIFVCKNCLGDSDSSFSRFIIEIKEIHKND